MQTTPHPPQTHILAVSTTGPVWACLFTCLQNHRSLTCGQFDASFDATRRGLHQDAQPELSLIAVGTNGFNSRFERVEKGWVVGLVHVIDVPEARPSDLVDR